MPAKKFRKMPGIKDTEGGNFGDYEEGKGGGTPRGGVWGGQNGRVGWSERENSGELPEGAHREDQPRTDDGKFTYNSVNGKETKYDGRGKTVNPLLTGGENGIKIDDVKTQFQNKQGKYYDRFKGKFYQKGSELVTEGSKKGKYTTKLASEDIWEIAKYSFDVKRGEFGGTHGIAKESDVFAQSKSGRSTQEETAAKALAKKTRQEQFVTDDTGAIKMKGDKTLDDFHKRLKKISGTGDLKHSPAQIKAVRDQMAAQGMDLTGITDEQIDQTMDEFIQF